MSVNQNKIPFSADKSAGVYVAETYHGVMGFNPYDDPIGVSLLCYGEWARNEIEFALAFIDSDSTVVDVGANIGTHTVSFSRAVGPRGVVVALEPQLSTCDLLQANIDRNSLKNVRVVRMGAYSHAGALGITKDASTEGCANSGASRLEAHSVGNDCDSVDVVTIDSLKIGPCAFVKIDVEGLEPEVLAGAASLIRIERPVVAAECNSISAGLALIRCADGWDDYQTYFVSSRAFNAVNFNRHSKNLFPGAWELSIVFVPNERANRLPREHEGLRILPIGGTEEYLEAFVAGIEASRSESLALMHSDLDQARQDVESMRISVRDSQREAYAHRSDLSNVREELHKTREELDETKVALALLMASPSWKITSPLRRLKRWIT
jgi:FkbM family methyltransferase